MEKNELYWAIALLSLGFVVHGYTITLSSFLRDDDVFINQLDLHGNDAIDFEYGFILSYYTGFLFGGSLSYIFADGIGRRTSLLYSAAATVLSFLWNAFSFDAAYVIFSRLLAGAAMGIMLSVAPTYIAEVSTAAERGRLLGTTVMATVIGSVIAVPLYFEFREFVFGWKLLVALPICLLLIQVCRVASLVESPRWLLSRRTPSECLNALRALRGSNEVSKEFNVIYRALLSEGTQPESWWDLLSCPAIRFQLFQVAALELSSQFVGVPILTLFGTDLLSSVGVHYSSSGIYMILFLALAGALLGLHRIDTWGRRYLLVAGCIIITAAWAGAAGCVSLGGLESGRAELYFSSYLLRYVFGSCLCLFSFANAFSIEMLSWVIPGEMFSFRARSRAMSLAVTCKSLSAILASYFVMVWMDVNDQSSRTRSVTGLCVVFAVVSVCVGVVYYFWLPELKGVPLEDIPEAIFRSDIQGCLCWNSGGDASTESIDNSRYSGTDYRHKDTNYNEAMDGRYRGSLSYIRNDPQRQWSGDKYWSSSNGESTYHKYSKSLQQSQFEYYQEAEQEPFVSKIAII